VNEIHHPLQTSQKSLRTPEASPPRLPTKSMVVEVQQTLPSSSSSPNSISITTTVDTETADTTNVDAEIIGAKALHTEIADTQMLDARLDATKDVLTKDTFASPLKHSRFANLGLNRRPFKFAGWNAPSEGRNVHTSVYVEATTQTPKSHSNTSDPDDELQELEFMMVPAALRQGFDDGGEVPIDPRPALQDVRTSKYSTGVLTSSGWTSISNEAGR
jgi:hypothetical protein